MKNKSTLRLSKLNKKSKKEITPIKSGATPNILISLGSKLELLWSNILLKKMEKTSSEKSKKTNLEEIITLLKNKETLKIENLRLMLIMKMTSLNWADFLNILILLI